MPNSETRAEATDSMLQAIRSLEQLRRLDPASGQVAQELARKRYELKDLPRACATLEAFLAHPEAEADLTHYNMLCELFLERRDWAKVLEWVERAKELMCGAEGLPIDLSVSCHAVATLWSPASPEAEGWPEGLPTQPR